MTPLCRRNVEYLNTLQQRAKWLKGRTTLNIGQLVLVKDEYLPPMTWALGRNTAIHPGKDDILRVTTIKTCPYIKSEMFISPN